LTDLEALSRDYRVAFLRYLPQRSEVALMTAYEIGRSAVVDRVSVLDLAQIHHAVLSEVLTGTDSEELRDVATAASEFFMEVLASFEMARDGSRSDRPDAPGSPA
jgi:Phosphoserine phosphatase RsbU, N-terminal domain